MIEDYDDNYQPPECDDVFAAGAYPDETKTVLREKATRGD